MKVLSEAYLPYRVGGLMYCPADNCTVADKIVENKIPCLTSLCLCLEDSVSDERLPLAEQGLKRSLEKLAAKYEKKGEKVGQTLRNDAELLRNGASLPAPDRYPRR